MNNPKARGLALLVLAVVSTAALWLGKQQPAGVQQPLADLGFYQFKTPRELAPVPLMDLSGQPLTLSDNSPDWQLVNFGYMYCPDICPQNLAVLSEFKTLWQAHMPADKTLRLTHITFDPERDTPENLSHYLAYIDSDLVGLTGELENIRRLAQQLNMVFIHGKPDQYGNYFISHSDSIALLNKQGHFVGLFKGPYDKQAMLKVMQTLIAQG